MIYQAIILETKNPESLSFEEISETLAKTFNRRIVLTSLNTNIIEANGLSIGIEPIKKISNWIWNKSDEIKVLVVKPAEKLTTQAQNSLLKLVEEPPKDTLIVFITSNSDMLIETIRSRCLNIAIDRQTEDKTSNIAEEFANS